MKPQDDISINPGATYPNLNNLDGSPFFAHIRLSGQGGKAPALHFRPRSAMAAGDFVLRAITSVANRSPKQDSLYK
ncbi:hypothetical protein CQR81_18345 [Escherichia coli]|nr:hypothetical protein CQR81_18345 [Escherichia coli]